ncbi:MAG: AbrB/MazE/SpoVT family DNA-binding domain-containing protein [bacterium]
MKAQIIKIGNSQGIRIPKTLLVQSGLAEEVEIEVQNQQIIIRNVRHPRQNWETAFAAMHEQGDDQLLDGDLVNLSSWDKKEWQW